MSQRELALVPRVDQGWRQKFSDRGAGASDRGLKRLKNGVSVLYFAKVAPTRTKISSDRGG